jgi:hypothetical protein
VHERQVGCRHEAPKSLIDVGKCGNDNEGVCFFQSAQKFKTSFTTFGLSGKAKLDEGHMWATAFAITELSAVKEARISELVAVARSM